MPLWLLQWVLWLLHRVQSRGPAVLGVLAMLIVGCGIPAFRYEAHTRALYLSRHEALYWTLGLFTLAGNPLGYAQTWPLRVLYFLAPFVSTSALLGALLHLLEQRAPLFARGYRNHTIVGGLGNLGGALVEELKKIGEPFVVIAHRDESSAAEELRASASALVLSGELSNSAVLKTARSYQSARVFFTSINDIQNLDAAFSVRRMAREKHTAKPPIIFAHVYDVALSDALEPQLRPRHSQDALIIPFNAYRIAAKTLVANLVRDRVVTSHRVAPGIVLERTAWPERSSDLHEPEDRNSSAALEEDRLRLMNSFRLARETTTDTSSYVVVGAGRFGQSVLRELLDSMPETMHFIVTERSKESLARFATTLSEAERQRVTLLAEDVTTEGAERLASFYPRAVLICADNDITNLRIALELRRRGIRVVTRLFGLDASSELVRGLEGYGISPVGLARLFRAAIPILTHNQKLRACINLDFARTPDVDHLFYLARVTLDEQSKLGRACVMLHELPTEKGLEVPSELALVWHQSVPQLSPELSPDDTMRGSLPPELGGEVQTPISVLISVPSMKKKK